MNSIAAAGSWHMCPWVAAFAWMGSYGNNVLAKKVSWSFAARKPNGFDFMVKAELPRELPGNFY